MNPAGENNYSGFTVIDIIVSFLNNRKKILYSTLFVCIISVILYFFVFDLIFLSTASIKSSVKFSSILGKMDLNIADVGFEDLALGGGKSAKELAAYEEILNSRKCLEELIIKFGLIQRDKYKYIEDAVKDFQENKLLIRQEKLAGIIYVGVYDKDPVLAKEMTDFLIEQLNKINIELNIQEAKGNREFIERRYLQATEDLKHAEDTLNSFQKIYGVAPDLQIKAASQSVFSLEAELKGEEIKLDVMKKILSSDQPEVKTQEARVNSLRSKVTQIQTSTDLNEFLRLGNSAQIIMSYLRLQREVEIQAKIVAFLLPVFEQAKIEEKRDTPTITVLDRPFIAERKTKPKRLTMVLVWTGMGFIFINAFFIVKNRWRVWKTQIDLKRISK